VTLLRLSKWPFRSDVQKRTVAFAIILAPVFTALAFIQICIVRHEAWDALRQEQSGWEKDVAAEIAYADGWNLQGYRNASLAVPAWYIVTSNGQVVDIEGYVQGVFTTASLPYNSVFHDPDDVTTTTGEKWRLFARKLDGGSVVVGMPMQTNTAVPLLDKKLRENIAVFPSSVDGAISTRSRSVDADVDYAILRDTGELAGAWGGVPLMLDAAFIKRFSTSESMIKEGKSLYAIFSTPIVNRRHEVVALIVIPRDVTAVEAALSSQTIFNTIEIGSLWLIAVVASVPFAHRVLSRQQRLSTLREHLKRRELTESMTVEFKPAFQWDARTNQQNQELRFDFLLKPVTAFLNTEGGTLFIGVSDDGHVCGIDGDLALFKQSTDRLELEMMQMISRKVSPIHSRFVRIHVDAVASETTDGSLEKRVCIVDIDAASSPAFLRWEGEVYFYKRTGNQSEPLDPIQQNEYIRTRWP